MAISLARMGSIPADNSDYYGVALARNNASAAARDARRKAAQDLQTGEIDLAAKALGQKELERTTSEAAQSRPIRSNFIINREQAEGIPIGIRSPNYVDDSRPATAPFGPTGAPAVRSPQERQTTIDLARVNPDYAEQFRNGQITERNGMEDRTRKQGFEDQTNIRANAADSRAADDQRIQNQQLSDAEKQQIVANNIAWFNAHTAQDKANKPDAGSQRDVASLRSQLDKRAKAYTNGKDAYAQALAEYDNYALNPKGLDAKANQQGIIDKYITSSTGKATTQEQFKKLVDDIPGIDNYVNNFGSKLSVGRLLPNAMINALMRNMRDYQVALGENLKQANSDAADEATIRGIDPRGVILTPDERLTSDSTAYASHKFGNEVTGKKLPQVGLVNRIFGTTPDEPVFPVNKGKAQGTPTFKTEAEADAAGLRPGTKVVVNGREGIWEP